MTPKATTTEAPTLTGAQAQTLAGDLLRELAEYIGDRGAVNAVLFHWLSELDARALSFVCVAAVSATFAECLTLTPLPDIPPGSAIYLPEAGTR